MDRLHLFMYCHQHKIITIIMYHTVLAKSIKIIAVIKIDDRAPETDIVQYMYYDCYLCKPGGPNCIKNIYKIT